MQIRGKNWTLGNFGVEIECYNVNKGRLVQECRDRGILIQAEGYNHQVRGHWKIVGDASVRGNLGCEVVSPILNGEDGIEQVKKVSEALRAVNAKVNKSCGLHVHHEARDFDEAGLYRIVKYYKRSEKHIDAFMPYSRRANNAYYCKSMLSTDRSITRRGNSRYYKVNLQSWYRQGTVEFRHHSGTVEADKIVNWVYFTGLIVERARDRVGTENPFEELYGVIFHIGATGRTLDPRLRDMVKFYKARTAQFAQAAA